MTHDERRLLCLVARVLMRYEDSPSTREMGKLVLRVQRHASVENAKAARRLVREFDRPN